MEITREIGDRKGEANSLNGLGNAYRSLGQYQQANDFYQQSLEIKREIGDRHGEANSCFNLGLVFAKLDRKWEAVIQYQNARQLYEALQLDHRVQTCDDAIREVGQVVASAPIMAPTIDTEPITKRSKRYLSRQNQWVLWFCVGLVIVVLILWLR